MPRLEGQGKPPSLNEKSRCHYKPLSVLDWVEVKDPFDRAKKKQCRGGRARTF